jgi:hypothetical protein
MIEVKNLQLSDADILALRREYESKGLGELVKTGHVVNGIDGLLIKLYAAISQPVFDKVLDAHKPEGRR